MASLAERKCSIALTRSPLHPCSTSSTSVRFWFGKILCRISMGERRPGRKSEGAGPEWAWSEDDGRGRDLGLLGGEVGLVVSGLSSEGFSKKSKIFNLAKQKQECRLVYILSIHAQIMDTKSIVSIIF